ncbi:104aa long hypothetical protein [Pyrococcus horikoshii OT3]|uniref:Uncharacterized protein n=1 Tax=Pyrococcus horikoshii (strain ATCC 700860 / DSM 12428 / JCM 9974 / NBRC 100139 / OT-3) TaxID=70601 RepID=O59399_PYRHO|nr:104aa long hypothetical protein [Pyrococcus horikoshii OT3]
MISYLISINIKRNVFNWIVRYWSYYRNSHLHIVPYHLDVNLLYYPRVIIPYRHDLSIYHCLNELLSSSNYNFLDPANSYRFYTLPSQEGDKLSVCLHNCSYINV